MLGIEEFMCLVSRTFFIAECMSIYSLMVEKYGREIYARWAWKNLLFNLLQNNFNDESRDGQFHFVRRFYVFRQTRWIDTTGPLQLSMYETAPPNVNQSFRMEIKLSSRFSPILQNWLVLSLLYVIVRITPYKSLQTARHWMPGKMLIKWEAVYISNKFSRFTVSVDSHTTLIYLLGYITNRLPAIFPPISLPTSASFKFGQK